MSLEYRPRNPFSTLSQTQLGQDLWEFMKRPENVKLMEDGTAQGRPAVELLDKKLSDLFDQQKQKLSQERIDRFKQMIGDMARRIMCFRGYERDKDPGPQKVAISGGLLFSSGTRYRKKRKKQQSP